jgi:hypothetical protein
MRRAVHFQTANGTVIPAKAGIHFPNAQLDPMDPRVRGDDDIE